MRGHVKARMRRLLLFPAAALVVLAAPVLALQQPEAAPGASVESVPLPSTRAKTVGAGFSEEVSLRASMIGVTWQGDGAASFSVEVRDGSGAWQPPVSLVGDDTAPDPGSADARNAAKHPQRATEPLYVRDATAVRVKLVQGAASNVQVAAINVPQRGGAGAPSVPEGSAAAADSWFPRIDGPARYAFALAVLAGAGVLVVLALRPSRRDRRGGRARGVVLLVAGALLISACQPLPPPPGPDPSCGNTPEKMSWLGFAVVHHTVGTNSYSPAESPGIVRGIQAYHQNTLHYCDIAYHFLIDRYGTIFEGRAGGTTQAILGSHTGGFNTGSTGIALMGTYSGNQASSFVWTRLVRLLSWKLAVHKVDPAQPIGLTSRGGGSRWPAGTKIPFANRIMGHRDLWPTECPGNAVYAQMGPDQRALIDAVKATPPVALSFFGRAQWGAAPYGG
jgi:hypothetical protein